MKKGAKKFRVPFLYLFSIDFVYIPFHSAYIFVIAGPIVKPHA